MTVALNALPLWLETLGAIDLRALDVDLTGVLRLLPCTVLRTGAHSLSL